MVEAAGDPSNGLQALLRKAHGGIRKEDEEHAISTCIIIAGTNDLACSSSPDEITEAILRLHSIAHNEGVRTISVDIPESAAAMMRRNDGMVNTYAEVRRQVNSNLQQAPTGSMRAHVPCPVPWKPPGQDGGDLWEPDGLHMSQEGYIALGSRLAPSVSAALCDWSLCGPRDGMK